MKSISLVLLLFALFQYSLGHCTVYPTRRPPIMDLEPLEFRNFKSQGCNQKTIDLLNQVLEIEKENGLQLKELVHLARGKYLAMEDEARGDFDEPNSQEEVVKVAKPNFKSRISKYFI